MLRDQRALRRVQVSGHVYTEEGKKVLALSGAWNGHLDMQPCDAEGDPLPGSQTTCLWQACPWAFTARLPSICMASCCL